MSKLKYEIIIPSATGVGRTRYRHEILYMTPFGGGKGITVENWNENSKSSNLMQGIGKQRSMFFEKPSDVSNTFYLNRISKDSTIEVLTIAIKGDGWTKKVNFKDVQIIPPTFWMSPLFAVSLKFNDSDIDENWSLNNP